MAKLSKLGIMISTFFKRRVNLLGIFESTAWKWMRYSALLLIPLVWSHLILQDLVVGVDNIDASYVLTNWAGAWGRLYSTLILAFAFAHGMNGLRQVLAGMIHSEIGYRVMSVILLVAWMVISALGAFAMFGGLGRL